MLGMVMFGFFEVGPPPLRLLPVLLLDCLPVPSTEVVRLMAAYGRTRIGPIIRRAVNQTIFNLNI